MAGRPPSGIGFMIRDVLTEAGELHVLEIAKRVNELRRQVGLKALPPPSVGRYIHEAKGLGLIEFVGKEQKPVDEQVEGMAVWNARRFYSISAGTEGSDMWRLLARSTASKM